MKIEKEVKEILSIASKFKRFPVYKPSLIEVGRLIYEGEVKDLWDLYKFSEEYIRVGVGLVEALRRKRLIDVKNKKIKLTKKGRNFFKILLRKSAAKDMLIKESFETIKLGKGYKKILSSIKKVYDEFTAKDRFDQAPLMPEAAIKKVAYAIQKRDIVGKSVVCVGDDDFVSLILGITGLPKEVLAIDLDDQIIYLIDKYSKKLKLKVPVKTLKHDLRKPIPEEWQNKFDTFITEPPDTVLGFTLFVSRGVELLKKGAGYIGYAGLTQTACPPLGILKIQEILTKMGLIITSYLPKFSTYPSIRTELKQVYVPDYVEYPPTKAWYISDLVRLKTTAETKPLYKSVFKKIAYYRMDSVLYQ